MTRRFAVHPLLVAAFPVLFLWSQNLDEVLFGDVVAPLLWTLGITAAVFLVASLAFRDHRRGAVAASGLAFLFLAYGHVWDVVNRVIAEHWILLAIWFVLAVAVMAGAVVVRDRLPEVTGALNLVAVVMLVTTLVPLAPRVVGSGDDRGRTTAAADPVSGPAVADPNDRDIFYLVLDRYPSATNMEELFGADNAAFTGFLEERGFDVAEDSIANYPKTAHSLAASLNMRYLDHLADRSTMSGPFDIESSNWQPIYQMLAEHRVGRFLKDRGYRYIHVGTWWDATGRSPIADVNLRYGTSSEFTTAFVNTTPIPAVKAILGDDGDQDTRSLKRSSTLYQFRQLDEIARHDPRRPRFVFAHLTIPHEPYVFDAEGGLVTRRQEAQRSFRENFMGQVEYANARISRIVERLLAGPDDQDPIIILQADEGPHPYRYRLEEDDFIWTEATDAELLEKFRILNAYHLPGLDGSPIYEEITPVNSFRVILDRYFDANLELLPDNAYVFYDEQHLYDFTEVTERIRDAGPLPDDFRP
ncbi:MAG: LTA synthase family protein [Actinobacteria bacterium]|nr:LTA synthase family protein [Actinomycetota bacterium]